jgi:outer membrane protein TolC
VQYATQMKSATTRIELARQTIKWAQLNVEAEKAKFSVGRSTNNDVVLRQQELKDAQLQLVRAQIDYYENENYLLATTGELLDRNHVTLQEL